MNRPKLLDLFCCQGGAAMGYHRAGFDVVGVDIAPQPNYPFKFFQGNALGFAEQFGFLFDVIHASPPCQSFLALGAVNKALGRDYDYPNLIGPTRNLLQEIDVPYVIENVEAAKKHMADPVRICGTGLGQPIRRHRLLESNIHLEGIACAHERYTEPKYWTGWRPNGEKRLSTVVQVYGNAGGQHEWPAAMGIDWMDRHGLVESVPPSYTEHIGAQLMSHLMERAA